MKDKLEVGMYVRTKTGEIHKIKTVETRYIEFENGFGVPIELKEYIKKHSKNIIDLIEVGDILEINNEKYEVIYDESYEKLGILIPSKKELSIRHSSLEYVFKKYKVSIVTKEQFEIMEYKLGDDK